MCCVVLFLLCLPMISTSTYVEIDLTKTYSTMVLILRKPSPSVGLRPETLYRLDRTKSKSKAKGRAQGWPKVKVFLEDVAVVLLLAALCTFLFIIASKSAVHEESRSLTLIEAEDNYVQQPLPTSYQCALVCS